MFTLQTHLKSCCYLVLIYLNTGAKIHVFSKHPPLLKLQGSHAETRTVSKQIRCQIVFMNKISLLTEVFISLLVEILLKKFLAGSVSPSLSDESSALVTLLNSDIPWLETRRALAAAILCVRRLNHVKPPKVRGYYCTLCTWLHSQHPSSLS